MRYLILGKTGLLGQALIKVAQEQNLNFRAIGSSQDLFLEDLIIKICSDFKPSVIINTIAYTKVDQAETSHVEATYLNSQFPTFLFNLVEKLQIKLVHFSTDYVFDGTKQIPYIETDLINPQSVYGSTKSLGEKIFLSSAYSNWLLLRVSWLFGPFKENFLSKILLKAQTQEQLKIVDNQQGNPTYTINLAQTIFELIQKEATGLFHFANQGSCTWYQFAFEFLKYFNLETKILPCTSDQFQTAVIRPKNSSFDLSKITSILSKPISTWQDAVKHYLKHYYQNFKRI